MFSGIVEMIGTLMQIQLNDGCKIFTINHHGKFTDLNLGDSVSVNGVCLTVTAFDTETFTVTIVPETLRLTNLDSLSAGSNINLERSLTLNQRIGGHYVQGHVDCIGKLISLKKDNSSAYIAKISAPSSFTKYIVKKGYITLDGMSITIIDVDTEWFSVTFIPHTQEVTIVHQYKIGDSINVEVDITGKYIEKFIGVFAHANSH